MMSCDIIQILSQTIPDAIQTFSQISIWLCYIWLLYDSYACCYHSIFQNHSISSRSVIVVSCSCDAYVLLSVMMMSSFCLDSPLLAVVPYCWLSPLFMYLLMNACHSSFFILHSSFSIHLICLCLYNLISVSSIRLDYNTWLISRLRLTNTI